jgi:lincosamide nucleotidyltransferase A/C/D/E
MIADVGNRDLEETTLAEVIRVLDGFGHAGIRSWLEGGWGVDALVGHQTRPHRDVDVDIDAAQEPIALEVLRALGYETDVDWRPNRIELVAESGARVDLHPLLFNPDGSARQPGLNGAVYDFPKTYFTTGSLDGRPVGCFTVDAQRYFRTGYQLRPVDVHDLAQLDRLG